MDLGSYFRERTGKEMEMALQLLGRAAASKIGNSLQEKRGVRGRSGSRGQASRFVEELGSGALEWRDEAYLRCLTIPHSSFIRSAVG